MRFQAFHSVMAQHLIQKRMRAWLSVLGLAKMVNIELFGAVVQCRWNTSAQRLCSTRYPLFEIFVRLLYVLVRINVTPHASELARPFARTKRTSVDLCAVFCRFDAAASMTSSMYFILTISCGIIVRGKRSPAKSQSRARTKVFSNLTANHSSPSLMVLP